MPDQWERHSRTTDWWEPSKSRSQSRYDAWHDDPTRNKTHAKRDPDKCKANHWGPHKWIIKIKYPWCKEEKEGCGWSPQWIFRLKGYTPKYRCYHVRLCESCGKHGPYGKPIRKEQCPDWVPEPEGLAERCEELNMEREARLQRLPERLNPRTRFVKGPTHYRKPKSVKDLTDDT